MNEFCEMDYSYPQVIVGQEAPDFTAPAVLGDNTIVDKFNFKDETKGKYALVFFYPLDFTFVCPTELIALDKSFNRFKELGVKVIGVSIDSHFSHLAWKNTPVNHGGIGQVAYPIVADMTHEICQSYGVEAPGGMAYRAAFIIDEAGIVRHMVVNDLPLGRNIHELIRTVEALQHHEKFGEVCPANWQKGEDAMIADPELSKTYFNKQ